MDRKLKQCLDANGVVYDRIAHAPTITAMETAEAAHVPGRELAKSVILRADDQLVMAVVPATHHVDLQRMRAVTGAEHVDLAAEQVFEPIFDDCEPGAMPPFGNLYGMMVYASKDLALDEEIAFNAGTHDEAVKIRYTDFVRLAHPIVGTISAPTVRAEFW